MTAILVTNLGGREGGGVQNWEQDKPLEPTTPGNQHGNTGEQEEVVPS